jgi:DUF4097 and DUF4098 domain-containing protein YvlB
MLAHLQSLLKNRIGLAVGSFIVALLIVSAGIAGEYKADFNYTESASGLDRVFLKSINGDVAFTGTEGETIQIKTHMEIEGESDAFEEYRKEFRTAITRSNDGRLVIETVYPKDEGKFEDKIKNSSIDYDITIPRKFGIKTETVNSDISVAGTRGNIDLEAVNGDISLKNDQDESGEIQIETVNGEIEINVLSLTNGGDIESVNGEISVRILENLKSRLSIETVNGEIELAVPKSAAFTLDAEAAMNGEIETDWGDREDEQAYPGGTFSKEINGGGEKIKLETVNGSIEVHGVK